MKYQFNYECEIRFGPAYYSLEIDGKRVPDFVYGFKSQELDNGRFLAVEEWLTTDYQKGPITRVAIFDLERNRVARLKTVDKGFVCNFKLEDGVFSYRKDFIAKGKAIESELDWISIIEWCEIYS